MPGPPKADDPEDPGDAPATILESTIQLIARARAGDQAALEELFARHLPQLRRWARGRLPKWARDVADTDDLVQETLLSTLRRIGDFEPRHPGALYAYLRQALVNRIRDELRRKGRRLESTDLEDVDVAGGLSPLELAIGHEAVDRYDRALAQLKPDERGAIVARIELGYSYEQLAGALRKPSAEAARKATHRALVRLAEEMDRAAGQP